MLLLFCPSQDPSPPCLSARHSFRRLLSPPTPRASRSAQVSYLSHSPFLSCFPAAGSRRPAFLAKVERYTEQILKRRVIKGLRPQNKEAKASVRKTKKPLTKKGKAREEEVKRLQKEKRQKKKQEMGKQRHRTIKSKGKPNWAGKKKPVEDKQDDQKTGN